MRSQNNPPRAVPHVLQSLEVYTILCLFRKIQKKLSLEAMLEYMKKYLETIETNNPELKKAVHEVMAKMDVEKIYREAVD